MNVRRTCNVIRKHPDKEKLRYIFFNVELFSRMILTPYNYYFRAVTINFQINLT